MNIINDYIASTYDIIVCPFCGVVIWREKLSWFERLMYRLFKQDCLKCGKKF